MPEKVGAASIDQKTGAIPKVRWDDSGMKSSYANVCNVASTREEVTLLFGTNQTWHAGMEEVSVRLSEDASVKARGRVREVAPQADPVTRTFAVKVGLTAPPPAMRLGATVTGSMYRDAHAAIELPATALTQFNRQPAVWIVDPTSNLVAIRNVDVLRYDPAMVAISAGLDVGEIVVTAGVQALHPGQQVRLLGSAP